MEVSYRWASGRTQSRRAWPRLRSFIIFEIERQATFTLYDDLNERKNATKLVPRKHLWRQVT